MFPEPYKQDDNNVLLQTMYLSVTYSQHFQKYESLFSWSTFVKWTLQETEAALDSVYKCQYLEGSLTTFHFGKQFI